VSASQSLVETEKTHNGPELSFNPIGYAGFDQKSIYPWRYLNAVSIDKICEMVLHGWSPKKIAKEVRVSQLTLKAWIEGDDERLAQYNRSLEYQADNMQFDALEILDNAPLISEAINKAGKQAEQRRVMAGGFGKSRWGKQLQVDQKTAATVHYNFNIALDDKQKAQVIEGESRRVGAEPLPELDINDLIGSGLGAVDLSIGVKDGLTYEEALGQEEPDGHESEDSDEEAEE
jgi:hypothetical protein